MKEQYTSLMGLTVAVMMIAGGCSVLSPQQDRSRYFVLTPAAGAGDAMPATLATGGQPVNVGLGPIAIPRYLNRPEVVTRLADAEFSISETDRWGEPLESNVSNVLEQDLSRDLPGLRIVQFPWSNKTQIDYRVSVEFLRLERTADGKVEVQAQWTVQGGQDSKRFQSGATTASLSAGGDQRSAAAALSEGIGQVSRDIARAVRSQAEQQAATRAQARLKIGSAILPMDD